MATDPMSKEKLVEVQQGLKDLANLVAELSRRVESLERRLFQLERRVP